jgi:hypothetical protein
LLLSQKQGDDVVAIIAIQILEAHSGSKEPDIHPIRNLAYVQFVDTSGWTGPRVLQARLTEAMIHGYILAARLYLCIDWIIWYATGHENDQGRAGSLFFSGSENNTKKTRLIGKQVADWWVKVTSHSNLNTRPYIWSPVLDSSEAPKIWANSRGDDLEYIPMTPLRLDRIAERDIPRFPDDPISRHYEALYEKASKDTVRMFLASLSLRPEYRKGHGYHFWLPLDNKNRSLSVECDTACHSIDHHICHDKLDFSTLEQGYKSTKYILEALGPCPCTSSWDVTVSVAPRGQMLVKEKTTQAEPKDIQSLVKRKKT